MSFERKRARIDPDETLDRTSGDRFGEARANERRCDWPGCEEAGVHRAPRSRNALRDYVWYCLDHVREYNQKWNYFDGMDQDACERHRRDDVTWHRPSWRFGAHPGFDPMQRARDDFGFFREERKNAEPPPPAPPADAALRRDLAVMGLEADYDLPLLKERYKELAKRNHPDLNQGDREAGERLKLINEAYTNLRSRLAEAEL